MQSKFTKHFLMAAVAAAVLAGCGKKEEPTAAAPEAAPAASGAMELAAVQELIRNNGSEPETLDPALAESTVANNITREMFEGLTAINNQGEVVPGVAESWSQTAPTTWSFKLRPNAKWSNGEAVTAEDFVYSVRRFFDPATASEYAASYAAFVLNAKEIVEGKKKPEELGIKAVDAQTVEITTPAVVTFLPEVLTNGQFAPVHKATVEKFGKEWTKPGNIVGNGAFTLADWQVNSKIVLAKSDNYWDKDAVKLTKVTYLPIEAEDADIKMFESGENHWTAGVPAGNFEMYKSKYPAEIKNNPMLGIRYYSYQNKDPMLKDVRIRKALSMVIDRNLMAEKVTADGQTPVYGVIVKGTRGAEETRYDWADKPMEERVAEAKKLLEEAGVKPGTKVKFSYNTSEYHKKMAIFVASEWKEKLGIEMEMEAMEFKVLIKKRNDGEFQLARNGWIGDYNDATTFLTLIECGSDQNNNHNCNEDAQKLIVQGNAESDQDKRKALLTEAAKMIMEDYPMIPLLQYTQPRLVKSFVGGYSESNIMDRFRSKDLYIIKH